MGYFFGRILRPQVSCKAVITHTNALERAVGVIQTAGKVVTAIGASALVSGVSYEGVSGQLLTCINQCLGPVLHFEAVHLSGAVRLCLMASL